MTLAQLYQLIDDNIKQNYNEEITAVIDNSVRHAVVDWVADNIGDLSLLNTNNKADLVVAINEIATKLGGIQDGAEKNVQADLGVTDSNSDAYVKGKSDYALKTYVNTKTAAVQSNLDDYENTQLAAIAIPDWKTDMQNALNF